MERTDELLMEAYRDGDESAFPTLVHRYRNLLYGYLMRMVQNSEIAEDCFQETFLRVHRKAHTYRSGAKFKGWLYTIATRIAVDRLRRNARRLQTEPFENEDTARSDAHDPSDHAEQSELRQVVQAALETLPPQQRAALVLAYYQGHTYPEVAQIMGCSLGTVKSHMSRALKKLSTQLPKGGVL
ncbi:MAG: sigma-70 family RNA polymerase sigma factor [Pontiellaceae bacterium]|nr:sigma-70 family RNA polymerase sigma factor [Pontiellaceae bacterium]MBN2783308.1 sigma-70 family RNA polymerase sigma factor [Pontiellaceae bacterium]